MYSTASKSDIRSKTSEATNDIHEGVRRAGDDMREAVSNVKEDLEDIARQTGQSAREFVGNAERNVVGAAESLTEKMYDHPIESSLIALGVGMILGLMMFRGR